MTLTEDCSRSQCLPSSAGLSAPAAFGIKSFVNWRSARLSSGVNEAQLVGVLTARLGQNQTRLAHAPPCYQAVASRLVSGISTDDHQAFCSSSSFRYNGPTSQLQYNFRLFVLAIRMCWSLA